jgi:hypothetical protein
MSIQTMYSNDAVTMEEVISICKLLLSMQWTYSTMGLVPSSRIVSPRHWISDRDCTTGEPPDGIVDVCYLHGSAIYFSDEYAHSCVVPLVVA